MRPRIEVTKIEEGVFDVGVMEGKSESSHRVSLSAKDYDRLTRGGIPPEELIRRSFEFLLEHESKESILARFDLSVISRYFPHYEREIKKRLGTA